MCHNRLTNASSPYLLQHKDNPVHWWEWGEEALQKAQAQDKPILLSIGYSACHWCHVMAHESFEDQETADLMNQLFINIKVDREERPDIDYIYMRALHSLGEQGGWPLTMFLTPFGEPFWGGTYFPPTARYGRPSFKEVLGSIAHAYETNRDAIEDNKQILLQALQKDTASREGDGIDVTLLTAAAQKISSIQDPINGGLNGAPKFPQASVQEVLFRAAVRESSLPYREQFLQYLDRMGEGGIYDHLGGGLARYAVDSKWLIPHFEKMLYDNAQYIQQLSWAYAATGDTAYKKRIDDVVGWIEREMSLPDGILASALDADSEGEEGKFYVWSYEEIEKLITNTGQLDALKKFYDVAPDGNWEGKIILNRLAADSIPTDKEKRDLDAAFRILFTEREKRIRPHRDDKALTDWNAMTVVALISAFDNVSCESNRTLATRVFAATREQKNTPLPHSTRLGKIGADAFAADYAWMARAALALARTEPDEQVRAEYYQDAEKYLAILKNEFKSDEGGFFFTSHTADKTVIRPLHAYDEATPNYNSVAALAFIEHWVLTDSEESREIADQIISRFGPLIAKNVTGTSSLLNAFDTRIRFKKVILPSAGDADQRATLTQAIIRKADPAIIMEHYPGPASNKLPINFSQNEALYICSEDGCSLPITDPSQF
ncbi:thioredoxin domain-containing protein [Rhodobacteraceae bacterium RKSG542]|nr:thioredoxin domain-containing protein [Pseudovibrio flavus]